VSPGWPLAREQAQALLRWRDAASGQPGDTVRDRSAAIVETYRALVAVVQGRLRAMASDRSDAARASTWSWLSQWAANSYADARRLADNLIDAPRQFSQGLGLGLVLLAALFLLPRMSR